MKKIIIYDSIHERAIKFLEQENDVQIFCVEAENRSKLLSLLPSADGIILRYLAFDEELIKVAHNLKTISRHGVGYDNIDIKSATDCGIPVTTIGDVNAVTVSELTMYFILAAAKQGLKYDQAVRENNWQIREELDSFELFNKNILIIGFGRIGSRVAPRVKSFESKVFVCDPYISQDIITKSGYIAVTDWREAIGDMDIVTLHVPLTDETKYMIDDNVIKNMKTGAILVNAARGALETANEARKDAANVASSASTGILLGAIALILGVVALSLAVLAFQRSGRKA